jgi:hypothetical protein
MSGGFAPHFGIETRSMLVGSAAVRVPPAIPISCESRVRKKFERSWMIKVKRHTHSALKDYGPSDIVVS